MARWDHGWPELEVGKKYGRLTVAVELEPLWMARQKQFRRRARFLCECGGTKDARVVDVRQGQVSCCDHCRPKRRQKHALNGGQPVPPERKREYRVFRNMRSRRGTCPEWLAPDGFSRFLEAVGPCPGPEYRITRIDLNVCNGPGNTIWRKTHPKDMRNRNKVRAGTRRILSHVETQSPEV